MCGKEATRDRAKQPRQRQRQQMKCRHAEQTGGQCIENGNYLHEVSARAARHHELKPAPLLKSGPVTRRRPTADFRAARARRPALAPNDIRLRIAAVWQSAMRAPKAIQQSCPLLLPYGSGMEERSLDRHDLPFQAQASACSPEVHPFGNRRARVNRTPTTASPPRARCTVPILCRDR